MNQSRLVIATSVEPARRGRASRRPLWLAAAVAALLVSPGTASAQGGSGLATQALYPPAPYGVTEIDIHLWGVEVLGIDERANTYEVEADLEAWWVDERLAFDEEEVGGPWLTFQGEAAEEVLGNQVWWPDFEIQDGRRSRDRMLLELSIGPGGNVYYHERFNATIKQRFDLARFPFDTSVISLTIGPANWGSEWVVFQMREQAETTQHWEPDEWWFVEEPSLTVLPGRACSSASCSEDTDCAPGGVCDEGACVQGCWQDADCGAGGFCQAGSCVQTCMEDADCPGDGVCLRGFASATVEMTLVRDPTHYVWKIILPLTLIVLVTSAVFWLDLERFPDPGDRLAVSFTGVLTVVAFDFVTSGSLPKLWYTTTLDKVLITAYVFVAVNILENIVATALSRTSNEAARRVDRLFRWLFPLAFLTVLFGLLLFG